MTANSDYGVSIVESFTPPKNWQPGQEINKDVYAVNTGNIDAFVKETVKGVLDYTYESKVANWSTDCVTLEDTAKTVIDGATTEEAGGFLAWTSVTEGTSGYIAPGTVVSARETEEPAVDGRWTPTAEGVYIFRRSYTPGKPQVGSGGDDPDYQAAVPEKYTYAGYYYDGAGKYYKIVIGNDNFRAAVEDTSTTPVSFVYDISADDTDLGGTAVVGKDGIITGTPDIHYVLLNKVDNNDVNFGYVSVDSDNTYGADYLTVRFSNTSGDMEAATEELNAKKAALDAARDALTAATTDVLGDKSKTLTEKEVALRNAEGAYNSAKSRYDQTKADYVYAKALKDAADALKAAADARKTAEDTRTSNYSDLETKRDAVKEEATSEKGTFTTEMTANTTNYAFDVLIPEAVQNLINNNGPEGQSELTGAKQNMNTMRALWSEIKSLEEDIKADYKALEDIKTDRDLTDTTSDTDIETIMAKLEADMAKLQARIATYKATYQTLKNQLAEASLSGLVNGDTVNNMAVTNSTANMRSKVNDYKTSYTTYKTDLDGAYDTAVTTWNTAVTTYNNAVSTAKTAYETAIGQSQPEPNAFGYLQGTTLGSRTLKDYGNTLLSKYTRIHQGGGDSEDTDAVGETADTDYTKYAGGTVESIADEKDFEQLEADPSGAKQTLGTSSSTDGLWKAQSDKETAKTTANTDYTTAKTALEGETGYSDFAAKQTAYETALANLNTAQAAVDAAATGSSIEIDVVLDAGVNAASNPTWTVDTTTVNTTAVDFYLNKSLFKILKKALEKNIMKKKQQRGNVNA